ncbi:N-acyl homoserine lactonase family protein [Butyrivibrio sp. YAB3001]|uniref:N-acyl homoserine lactonase family protein n=1 Tax=Butyrivibrio sp. YAB3001 TaxID=1520812 RepID=UPI0008F61B60|nr:N-acyl homoserine lactonase family protein [Butyrivibrio sp. YAB3001]SFC12536.1 N-acyl homoserine lactone hydrolase [Butyrivibrio sp. YAB3001]
MINPVSKVVPMYLGKVGFKFNKQFLRVYGYLIYMENGDVYLFDSGLNPLFYSDKEKIMENLTHFIEVDVNKDELLANRLKEYGIDKESIKAVIVSHLHFDHAGGISVFENTNVPLVVQKREYEEAKKLVGGRSFEYKSDDLNCLEERLNVSMVEGDSVVDGNEAIECLATYGHSAGHQSLLLKGKNKKMLLVGDAAYTRKQLDDGVISTIPFKKQEALSAIDRMQKMADECEYVICGHDCEAFEGKEILL